MHKYIASYFSTGFCLQYATTVKPKPDAPPLIIMHTDCQLDQFKIIYQDDHLVAIHKPAGLLVHRSPIDKHETRFALQMTRDAIGQPVHTLHRLDKATSGLLLFALDRDTAQRMGEQFEATRLQTLPSHLPRLDT